MREDISGRKEDEMAPKLEVSHQKNVFCHSKIRGIERIKERTPNSRGFNFYSKNYI